MTKIKAKIVRVMRNISFQFLRSLVWFAKELFHLQEMENLQLPVQFCFVLFKMRPQQIPKNNHDQAWPT